mmetsp:Transcript_53308/g.149691  ORF Transcript_53308/g.149691 Transcript_53308/m.149691 type:complete len:265 (+) Transcript_53308:1014-1808(+)
MGNLCRVPPVVVWVVAVGCLHCPDEVKHLPVRRLAQAAKASGLPYAHEDLLEGRLRLCLQFEHVDGLPTIDVDSRELADGIQDPVVEGGGLVVLLAPALDDAVLQLDLLDHLLQCHEASRALANQSRPTRGILLALSLPRLRLSKPPSRLLLELSGQRRGLLQHGFVCIGMPQDTLIQAFERGRGCLEAPHQVVDGLRAVGVNEHAARAHGGPAAWAAGWTARRRCRPRRRRAAAAGHAAGAPAAPHHEAKARSGHCGCRGGSG